MLTGFFFFSGLTDTASGQHQHKHIQKGEDHSIVCYYTDDVVERYIPPPKAYTSRLKSGQEAGAQFIFTIENALDSAEVAAACQKAGEIWGSLIHSSIPINVRLIFADQDYGTLASTGTPWPPRLVDDNGYLPRRYYVQSIAEKMYRQNLNGKNPDMTMTFNQNVAWWYGLEENTTPLSRYDFLSTLLHEMAHGLGFFGYFQVDDDGLGYGLGIPTSFDGFFETDAGVMVADTIAFPQPSKDLGDALTSPPIYFNSPIALKELPDETTLPKMYITNPWRGGNSLYHLDLKYDWKLGGRDALMTYAAAKGEAIHDPGPITTYMLYEIGWVHTFIDVDTLKDRETIGEPFTVVARIQGDQGIKENSQKLTYSFNGFQSDQTVNMVPTGNSDEFKANIPVSSTGTTVHYFVQSTDTFNRVYTMPSQAPENFYRFHVGPDNTPPEIIHSPIKYMLALQDSVLVKAEIWDNLGLKETTVEYKINDTDQTPVSLEHDTLADYKGYMRFSEGQIKPNDVIKYRIKAVDASAANHTTYTPESGYHEFSARDVPPFVETYSNDFEGSMDDFESDGFSKHKPGGWSSFGLHTDHPYFAHNRDNTQDEITATLIMPIKLSEVAMHMKFDEIAYIEEGEEGSEFGDWNFWDYVIVEGSKDDGNTWIPFEDGWDCRQKQVWFDEFTKVSNQDGNLSTAVPNQGDMRHHLIDMLAPEEFNGGDIVLIRFRLFSDPYYAGWGWAIDNLEIGPVVSIENHSIVPDAIDIYPNPTNGFVTVRMQLLNEVDALDITLYNLTGQQIFRESFNSPERDFNQYFNLDYLPNGVYLMKLSSGQQSIMKKVILSR